MYKSYLKKTWRFCQGSQKNMERNEQAGPVTEGRTHSEDLVSM